MKYIKYILMVVMLSLAFCTSCAKEKTVKVEAAPVEKPVVSPITKDLIMENAVAWDAESRRRQTEIRQVQIISDFMDQHKGELAKREAIPSSEIYSSMKKHCATYGIGVDILIGLTIAESNISQKPRDSVAGCRGICQVSRYALEDFNTNVIWKKYHDGRKFYTWDDMYDYDKNIEVACYYLRWLWNSFDDIRTIEDVLISYNAGHGKLAKYKAINDISRYHYHVDIIGYAKEYNARLGILN